MYSITRNKGFAVLASALLLSIAGIAFTTNMASTQLIDNQVMGNYYRNNEAFVNAESGINLILSKLTAPSTSTPLLANLPFQYSSTDNHYTVTVNELAADTLEIISSGTSMDGSAKHEMQLQVSYSVEYSVPVAPIASNGKLNLDASATLNNGCEGLSAADCSSPENIAEKMLISRSNQETEDTDCAGGSVGSNVVSDNVYYGDSTDRVMDNVALADWDNTMPAAESEFFGLTPEENLTPTSLFEMTFGISLNAANKATIQGDVSTLFIDMTLAGAVDCSTQLANVTDAQSVIYIKGDCNIMQFDASDSLTSENKRFTIGSADNPKMVFIEGGTFITEPNTGASVKGMLYFIPGVDLVVDAEGNTVEVEQSSVDMGGIRVDGALLSEYKCSHDGYDASDPEQTKQHFSARYNKAVLNTLYEELGMAGSASSYQLVEGTWRDF